MKNKKGLRTCLFSAIIFCLMAAMTACQPKPLLPIPKGRILFALQATRYPFSDFNIYSINTDGFGAKRLTDDPNGEFDPVWSPDGTQIAFISSDDSGVKLNKMNADGSHRVSLTPNLVRPGIQPNDLLPGGDLDWSPDGRRILFTRYGHIEELDLESGQASDLAANSQWIRYPKWSPEGTQIMFASISRGRIVIMNADGTDQRPIFNSPYSTVLLDWSPDGHWVALTEDYSIIRIMRPDGSQLRRLTRQCFEPSATFSPDSQWLVIACLIEQKTGIYFMNLEEGVLREISDDPPIEYFDAIDWAP